MTDAGIAEGPIAGRPGPRETPAAAARIRTGGLMLAVAAAITLLATLLGFMLPEAHPGADVQERAALVARSAGWMRLIGSLGAASAMALALSSALLIARPAGGFAALGRLAWRLMIVTAVVFLAVDLFHLFAIVPLARDASAGHGLYEYFERVDYAAIGIGTLLFSCATLMLFMAETSSRHRAIGSGWIAFGIVCACVGLAGGVGMLVRRPRLALLFIVSQLCFVPLLRLGIRVAAGESRSPGA
jgi:hypothetical protein